MNSENCQLPHHQCTLKSNPNSKPNPVVNFSRLILISSSPKLRNQSIRCLNVNKHFTSLLGRFFATTNILRKRRIVIISGQSGCFSFSEFYLLSFSELAGCNNSELKKGEGYKNSELIFWQGCKNSELLS